MTRGASIRLGLISLLCSSGTAWAQEPTLEGPGPRSELSGLSGSSVAPELPPTMTNVAEQLPAALGFTVTQRSTEQRYRHLVVRYRTTQRYPESALRLKELEVSGKSFAGGHRLVGWSHQFEGDCWWFSLLTPKGERYVIGLAAGEQGTTELSLDTHIDWGPSSLRVRRAYQNPIDLGPRL